jgi:hypothetical protein
MRVRFELNTPQILALADPQGDYNPDQEEVFYPTADGRILVLDTRAAGRFNELFLRPGETFGISRNWEPGLKGSIPRFDFWLTPASEQARAAEEIAQPEPQRPASITAAQPTPESPAPIRQRRQRRPKVEAMPGPGPLAIPAEAQRGTGTYGPAPRPAIHPRPGRIPMNVAFREVVQFVTTELQHSGEQWSDQSRQDLVSTIIISASRQGLLDVWERNA